MLIFQASSMEERTKKTLEECKKLELKLSVAEKEKKNADKKYTQVMVAILCSMSVEIIKSLCQKQQ